MRKLLAAVGRALRALFRSLGRCATAPLAWLFGGGADDGDIDETPIADQVLEGEALEETLRQDLARSAPAVSQNPGLRLVYGVQAYCSDDVFEQNGVIDPAWPAEVREWCAHLSLDQKEAVVRSPIERVFAHLSGGRRITGLPAFPLPERDAAPPGEKPGAVGMYKPVRSVSIEDLATETPTLAPDF